MKFVLITLLLLTYVIAFLMVKSLIMKTERIGIKRLSTVVRFSMKDHDNLLQSYGQDQTIIPIYPYDDGVILPTADVPIHFIVREDIEMIEYIQMKGKIFGMVLSDNGRIVEIGTIIENLSISTMNDKTVVSCNRGKQRFKIIEIIQGHNYPFLLAKVNLNVCDLIIEPLEELHQLQWEVYSTLQEVLHLTNYNSGIEGSLTDSVIQYAPSSTLDPSVDISTIFYNMTSFSFAVAEMV